LLDRRQVIGHEVQIKVTVVVVIRKCSRDTGTEVIDAVAGGLFDKRAVALIDVQSITIGKTAQIEVQISVRTSSALPAAIR